MEQTGEDDKSTVSSCSSLSKKRELEDRKETSPNKRKPESSTTADSDTITTTSESGTEFNNKEAQTTNPKMSDQPRIEVPLEGNAWCCEGGAITHKGLSKWCSEEAICKTYVYVSKPGSLKVAINMNPKGHSVIQVTIRDESILLEAKSDSLKEFYVGEWTNIPKGYLTIQIQGIEKTAKKFGTVSSLILSGSCICPKTAFVKDNTGNFFYWGRRGPSVHLNFTVPKKNIEWFYSELTVPVGNDVIGSYFMANGFSEGYFGIQVNSSTERRILFSVWSPFKTDDPKQIPQEQKIKLVKKGDGVYTGEFGNEGSGGQSYLVHPWKAGATYRFLLGAKPQESSNSTTFTAYFSSVDEPNWKLIASFQRPKIVTHLKGLYSFLENFNPSHGDQERMAFYDNQWVCDETGHWSEITATTFTGDNTARKKYRRDYSGGVVDEKFFLKNCGFFCEKTKLDTSFKRRPKGKPPTIRFEDLK